MQTQRTFISRYLRKTDAAPFSTKVRRTLAIGLWVFVFVYTFFITDLSEPTVLFVPLHVKNTALINGWTTALVILLTPLFFHWAIKPIDAPDSGGGSVYQMGIALVYLAWLLGGDVYEKHIFADAYDHRLYELPIIATAETASRSPRRVIITLALDEAQKPLWHTQIYPSGELNTRYGHCLHIDVYRTKSGARFAESSPHQAPCSRAWPSLDLKQKEYLRTYAYDNSGLVRSFKINSLIDYVSAGFENSTCPYGDRIRVRPQLVSKTS